MTLLLAQMGHVEKIAHTEMAHPEAQQASAKQQAAEALKHAQESVEKIEDPEESQLLLDKDGRSGGQGGGRNRKKRRQKRAQNQSDQSELADEDGSSAPEEARRANSPWQGNILNIKV